MRTAFSLLSFAVALAGCALPREGRATDWASIQLEGKKLSLIDDTRQETYSFVDKNVVTASIGTKDGPMTAPLYYWTVKSNTLVISKLPNQQVVEALTAPKLQGDVISANRKSGASVQYRLSTIR